MQEKIQQSATNISVAFQDLKMLMDMAKDMVRLANVMSNKIKVSILKKNISVSIYFYFTSFDSMKIRLNLILIKMKTMSPVVGFMMEYNEKY